MALTLLFTLDAVATDLAVGPSQPFATIDHAVAAAASGDRILVAPGTYAEGSIAIGSRALEVRAAAGPGTVFIEATGGDSLFDVPSGGALTLVDLAIDGAGARRLARVSSGTLTVEGCTATGVAATHGRGGGAIDATASDVTIRLSTFTTGTAQSQPGGFLALDGSEAEVVETRFEGGSGRSGGALSAENGSVLRVERSTFEANTAPAGAAIDADQSVVDVIGSTFTRNVGADGTIRCSDGDACRIEGSWLEGNEGTALLVDGTATTSLLTTVVCETAATDSVDLRATAARVEGSVFLLNTGRALRLGPLATAEVTNNHLVGTTGEALRIEGQAALVNTLIAYNAASGAVVSAATGVLTADYNLYFANVAADLDAPGGAHDVVGQDPLIALPGACDLDPLRVGPGSPATDAGDPALADVDGSRSDIGAFGGAQGGPPGDPTDEDADGWPLPNDCDDASPGVHPGAAEAPCNGIDDDCRPDTTDTPDDDGDGVGTCDGDCNDNDPDRTAIHSVFRDDDGDGFGLGDPADVCGLPLNASEVGGDCDDSDAEVFPGAVETPYDDIDQDCDGGDLVDLDGDGVLPPDDCDDDDPERFAGNDEIPDDGMDQDCTGADTTAILTGASGPRCSCQGAPGPGWAVWLALGLLRRRARPRPARPGTC